MISIHFKNFWNSTSIIFWRPWRKGWWYGRGGARFDILECKGIICYVQHAKGLVIRRCGRANLDIKLISLLVPLFSLLKNLHISLCINLKYTGNIIVKRCGLWISGHHFVTVSLIWTKWQMNEVKTPLKRWTI